MEPNLDLMAEAEQYDRQPSRDQELILKEDTDPVEVLARALKTGFMFAGMIGGDHWPLSDEDATWLATDLVPVLEEYAPGWRMAPEITLLATAAMIIGPRIMLTIQLRNPDDGDQPESKSPEQSSSVSVGDGVREVDGDETEQPVDLGESSDFMGPGNGSDSGPTFSDGE